MSYFMAPNQSGLGASIFHDQWAGGWLGNVRHTLYQLGAFGSVLQVGGKRVLAGRILDRDGSLVDSGRGLVLCGVRHVDCVVSERYIALICGM